MCSRKHYTIRDAFQESPNGCCGNSTGDTILHAAALLGEAKLVSALAHYRPIMNVDVKNNKGNHQDIKKLLILYVTRFYCNLILMHLTYYFIGNTPMHIAAMYNHSSCIEALLKHQSEAIDMQNFSGASPLQVGLLFYNLLCKYYFLWNFNCTFIQIDTKNISDFSCPTQPRLH